jgi:hypothetical protein
MPIFVKNWAKFQHFRNRSSPWIKLYRDLLDDPDWHKLDPKAAKTLIMLWMSAFGQSGELPKAHKLAFRLRMSEKELNQQLITLNYWLIRDDIELISNGFKIDSTEREGEEKRGERDAQSELISKSGRKHKPLARTIPDNWMPSENTLNRLGSEFKFTNGDAERYIAAFCDQCKAKGYEYRDFDAAFSNCVRQDWPKFRNGLRTMPKNQDPRRPEY